MTKDIIAPAGGVMTDEVGAVTGELTLATEVVGDREVILKVQYKGADEWYRVTDATIKVDDPAKLAEAEQQLLNRF
jgi:hypothetical protein